MRTRRDYRVGWTAAFVALASLGADGFLLPNSRTLPPSVGSNVFVVVGVVVAVIVCNGAEVWEL